MDLWICKYNVMDICMGYSLLFGCWIMKSYEYCIIPMDVSYLLNPSILLWETSITWWHTKQNYHKLFPFWINIGLWNDKKSWAILHCNKYVTQSRCIGTPFHGSICFDMNYVSACFRCFVFCINKCTSCEIIIRYFCRDLY